MHDPALTVRDIRDALRKVRADGLRNIRIQVDWHLYRDLLIIRGLPHDAGQRDLWGRNYENRPIQIFDGELIILSNDAAVVYGKTDTGNIQGWAIVGRI